MTSSPLSLNANNLHSRQLQRLFADPSQDLSYDLGQVVQAAPPFYSRLLTTSLCGLVVGGVTWAHFSRVEEVAIAPGQLTPDVAARPLKSLGEGSIRRVRVQEGAKVRQGQVLVERDPAIPEAEVKRLQNSLRLVRQDIQRLNVELQGRGTVGVALQDQLLLARLREFEQTRQGAIAEGERQQAAIAEAQARLQRLGDNEVNARLSIRTAQAMLANVQEREQRLSRLEAEAPGAFPRMDYLAVKEQVMAAEDRLIQAEDRAVSLERDQVAQRQAIAQAKQAYAAARASLGRLQSQRQSEILSRLNQRREELVTLEGQLEQANRLQKREVLRAPIAGTVYNLKATLGPVQSGEELMSILPAQAKLVVEAKLLNRDIGFVSVGDRVKIKVASFPYQEFGYLEGEVTRISPDAVTDKDLGLIFPVEIKVTRNEIQVQGKTVELQPGMMASAEIVTREKSILTFLLEPIARRFTEAFSVR